MLNYLSEVLRLVTISGDNSTSQCIYPRTSHVPQWTTTNYQPLRVSRSRWYWCPSLLPGVSHADARQPGKSPSFSVNWIVGNADLEVINATTGKRNCGSPSRLCKHMFFTRWAKLHGKVGLAHWWDAAASSRWADPYPVVNPVLGITWWSCIHDRCPAFLLMGPGWDWRLRGAKILW